MFGDSRFSHKRTNARETDGAEKANLGQMIVSTSVREPFKGFTACLSPSSQFTVVELLQEVGLLSTELWDGKP